MDAYLVGVFSLAAVALVVSLTVALTELLRAVRRRPTASVLLPRGDTERPGLDQDGRAYAGVGGGASADARTGRAPGAADGTHPLSEVHPHETHCQRGPRRSHGPGRLLGGQQLTRFPAIAGRSRPGPDPVRSGPGHRGQGQRPALEDDHPGEAAAGPAALRRPGHRRRRQGRGRRSLQPGRPGQDRPPPARGRRAVPAAHPDPVRLRHHPRLPHDLPRPAGRRRARSTPRSPRPTPRSVPASPRPSASSRSTARWSTSPTSLVGDGSSRATARTPTSAR